MPMVNLAKALLPAWADQALGGSARQAASLSALISMLELLRETQEGTGPDSCLPKSHRAMCGHLQ